MIGMTAVNDLTPAARRKLKEHLKQLGLSATDRRAAYAALCFLADNGGAVDKALGHAPGSTSDVCQALRVIVDGPNGEFW